MFTYILRRVLYSIPVLIVASFLIFTFVSAVGDPLAALKMNPTVSHQTLEKIEHEKHLDKSIPIRYFYWVNDAVTDYLGTTFSFLAFATPVFWLALILQIVFTDISNDWGVRIFYTSGLNSVDSGHGVHFLIDRAQHLGLPVMTLTVLSIAQYSRYLRASMLEVINSDYVRTARAKGLQESRVTMKHAFRNALIPLVTVVTLNFGALISGAVVTETVFQLDGMGPYFIDNLQRQDVYPLMAWL